ncbi:MAG: YjbQ family protein [Euryarchaeota archaeon]|nr:YjbQ family protein [Euryarchaeota archaeon]
MIEKFRIRTTERVELIDITSEVEDAVARAKVEEGIASVFTRHTTTAVFINEAESGLLRDYLALLERLVPPRAGYEHDRIDSNAHAHLRSMLLGSSVSIPIANSRLALGTWQRVLFAELDGPRERSFFVSVVRA